VINSKPSKLCDPDLGSVWACKLDAGEVIYLSSEDANSSEEAAQKATALLKEVADAGTDKCIQDY